MAVSDGQIKTLCIPACLATFWQAFGPFIGDFLIKDQKIKAVYSSFAVCERSFPHWSKSAIAPSPLPAQGSICLFALPGGTSFVSFARQPTVPRTRGPNCSDHGRKTGLFQSLDWSNDYSGRPIPASGGRQRETFPLADPI